MKKGNTIFQRILLFLLGLMMLGGAIFPFVRNGAYYFGGKAKDLYEVIEEDSFYKNEGKFVYADIDAIVDKYAETTHSVNFIPVGKDHHYIAFLFDDSFISISLPAKYVSDADRIIEETWEYMNGESDSFTDDQLHVEGTLTRLGGDAYKYYNEVLNAYGITEDIYEIRSYTIDATDSRLLQFVVSIVLLALAGLLFFAAFAKEKKPSNDITVSQQ